MAVYRWIHQAVSIGVPGRATAGTEQRIGEGRTAAEMTSSERRRKRRDLEGIIQSL